MAALLALDSLVESHEPMTPASPGGRAASDGTIIALQEDASPNLRSSFVLFITLRRPGYAPPRWLVCGPLR